MENNSLMIAGNEEILIYLLVDLLLLSLILLKIAINDAKPGIINMLIFIFFPME